MSYELSFTPEFFYQEGEPYDMDYGKSEKPMSVYQAVRSMSAAVWEEVANVVFGVPASCLTADAVMDKIREINTCTDLSSPVSVWIDKDGWYTVDVWDKQ